MSNIVSELKDQLERARATAKNLREQTQQATGRAVQSALTVGGGAAVGYMRGKWGEGPDRTVHFLGTEIDAPLAIGIGLQAVALTDMAGEYSDEANAVGAGMLAVVAAREVESAVIAAETKKASEKKK